MDRLVFGACAVTVALIVAAGDAATQISTGSRVIQPLTARCIKSDLRGSYGFYRTGVNAQGAIAAVGVGQFDGAGAMVTAQSTSRAGTVSQGSFPGTYDVTEDCRGVWHDPSGGVIAHFVLLGNGDEFFFLSTSAGNTITGHGKRITPSR